MHKMVRTVTIMVCVWGLVNSQITNSSSPLMYVKPRVLKLSMKEKEDNEQKQNIHLIFLALRSITKPLLLSVSSLQCTGAAPIQTLILN